MITVRNTTRQVLYTTFRKSFDILYHEASVANQIKVGRDSAIEGKVFSIVEFVEDSPGFALDVVGLVGGRGAKVRRGAVIGCGRVEEGKCVATGIQETMNTVVQ